jgi:hypothetical protein
MPTTNLRARSVREDRGVIHIHWPSDPGRAKVGQDAREELQDSCKPTPVRVGKAFASPRRLWGTRARTRLRSATRAR